MSEPKPSGATPRKRPPVAAIAGGVAAITIAVVILANSRPPTVPPTSSTGTPPAAVPVAVDPAQPAEHLNEDHAGHDHAAGDHTGHDHAKPKVPAPAGETAKPPPIAAPAATLPPAQRGGRPSATFAAPKPTTAPEDLPPDHPVVTPDNAAQVSVQWLGYSCFYIHSPGGAAVVTDPYDPKSTGLPPPGTGAHLVTVSSETPAHNHADEVRAFLDASTGQRLPKEVLRGGRAGSRADLKVTPVPTGGGNTAYLIESGPFRIAHLGALDRPLTEAQAKAFGRVDLLMLPVGERLAARDAVATAQRLNPRVVLPMAYRQGEGGGTAAKLRSLDTFVSVSPFAVTQKDADVMLISQADLPASTEIWTLKMPNR